MKRLFSILNTITILMLLGWVNASAGNVQVNSGSSGSYVPFGGSHGGRLSRIVFTAEELKNAGVLPGKINGMSLKMLSNEVPQNIENLKNFMIRVRHYSDTLLPSNYDLLDALSKAEGWVVCKGDKNDPLEYNLIEGGFPWNKIVFDSPFTWNGDSSIILEIGWNNFKTSLSFGDATNTYSEEIGYKYRGDLQNGMNYCKVIVVNTRNGGFESFYPEISSYRPVVRFDVENYQSILKTTESVNFDYVELNTESLEKSFEIDMVGATPLDGSLLLKPKENAYVSLDGKVYVTYPNELAVPYTGGRLKDKQIFCKIKGSKEPIAEGFHTAIVNVSAGAMTGKVTLQARCTGNIFDEYCSSFGREGVDIFRLSIEKNDSLILRNGKLPEKTTRLPLESVNKNGYSNFVNTVAAPNLKAGEEYKFSVDLATSDSAIFAGRLYVYIDKDRNGVLTNEEEIVIFETFSEGTKRIEKLFNMPEKLLPTGDGRTLMRVIVIQSKDDIKSCIEFTGGEVEDYAVVLVPMDTASIMKIASNDTGFDSYRPNEKNKVIGSFSIVINGVKDPYEVTEYMFNTEGITDVKDIEKIKLWYMGKNKEFIEESAILYDEISHINKGNNKMFLTKGDKSKIGQLPTGINHFFITCDIKKTATVRNFLDMKHVYVKLKKKNKVYKYDIDNPNPSDAHLIRNRLSGTIYVGGEPTGDPLNYYSDILTVVNDINKLGAIGDIELAIRDSINLPDNKTIDLYPINGHIFGDSDEPELREDIKLTIYPTKKIAIVGKVSGYGEENDISIFKFNSMKNVVIDGRINKQGDSNNITIINNGADKMVAAIHFYNGDGLAEPLSGIVVKNVNFEGKANMNKNSSALIFSTYDSKGVQIKHNSFSGYYNGINIVGDEFGEQYMKDLLIEENTFSNADSSKTLSGSGIVLDGTNNAIIRNNIFKNIVNSLKEDASQAILLRKANSSTKIEKNKISQIYANNNGSANGIVSASEGNTNILIVDNVISDVMGNGLEKSINAGFWFAAGDEIRVYHNLVYLEGNRSRIPGVGKGTPGLKGNSYAVNVGEKVNDLIMRNNIFVNNLNHNEDNFAKAYCISIEDPASLNNLDYNLYYTNGTNSTMAFSVDDKATLEAWAATVLQDKHSIYDKINFGIDTNVAFGTLDGNSAINPNLRVPAIDGLKESTDIHGNRRGTGKVTIGVDEVTPIFEITEQMEPEITSICAPTRISLSVNAKITGFNDDVERTVTASPEFKYQWVRNGKEVPNVIDGNNIINSNKFNLDITEGNIDNPDKIKVKVTLFDNTKISDECKIIAEGKAKVTKQPDKIVVLCTDSGVSRLEAKVSGTVGKLQWQKKVGVDEWKDLDGDNNLFLDVSMQNDKYGAGEYRLKIEGGNYICNKEPIYSDITEVKAVHPVDNARLISDNYDLSRQVVVCEGSTINVKLDRDESTGLKGDVVGYRWEEKIDGVWEKADLEERPFLTENGLYINYADTSYNGIYRLVVIGKEICGKREAISNEVNILVNPFVHITKQPISDVVCKGKNVILKVKTSAVKEAKYQWLKNGIIIKPEENETANSEALEIKGAKYDDAALYSVIVTVDECLMSGGNQLFSDNASIVVMNETQITKQPEDQDAMLGKKAMFVVESNAIGEEPNYVADYQWYRQYVREGAVHNEALEEGGKYNGVKSNILIIQNVEEKDAGYLYYVNIKGLCGDTVNSRYVMLKTTDFGFTHLEKKKKACDGEEVTLSALAESSKKDDAIIYEWHFVTGDNDEIDEIIPGDSAKIKVTANKYTQGKYYVIAKLVKLGNIIKSNYITLEVGTKPQITKPIAETNAKVGELFTLTSEAVGANFAYKWYREKTLIPNAVSANLTTSEAKAGTYTYMVVVSNECGSDTSMAKVSVAGNISNVDEVEEYGFTVSNIIPNPVVSNEAKFTVSSEVMSKAEITIVDAAGRNTQFFSGNIAGSKEFSINTSRYPNGAYYLVIVIDGKKMTRRFIVEK